MDKTLNLLTLLSIAFFLQLLLLPSTAANAGRKNFKCNGNLCQMLNGNNNNSPIIEFRIDDFQDYTGNSRRAQTRAQLTRNYRKCRSCRVYKNGKLLGQNEDVNDDEDVDNDDKGIDNGNEMAKRQKHAFFKII